MILTKEQLISAANARMEFAEMMMTKDLLPLQIRNWSIEAELARIALASLEAEPVSEFYHEARWGWYEISEGDSVPERARIPLYRVPPAPVSVPDGVASAIESLKQTLVDCNRYNYCFDAVKRVEEACRAAMLQGAEPVKTGLTLREGLAAIRNSGIAIDAEKIQAERDALNDPDCWCRTCRPMRMNDMRFVVCPECGNKRCPHANDHWNACTGSNEPGQEGSAYPAAPQQEAK